MVSTLTYDPAVHRQGLTRAQYDILVASGALQGMPVELLEGEIVRMAPQGPPHSRGIDILARSLDRRLVVVHGESYAVRQEKPFAASNGSEPEPDIAVVNSDQAAWGIPDHPSHAHLIVEVSDSSVRVDLAHKPRIYAASGVPQYWVIDLSRRRVVVHTLPLTDPVTGESGYDSISAQPFTQPLSVLGIEIRLSDLLPDLAV